MKTLLFNKLRLTFFSLIFLLNNYLYSDSKADSLDFKTLPLGEIGVSPLNSFKSRNGTSLGYRNFPSKIKTNLVLILIHGSASHSSYSQSLASKIAKNGKANVYTPDLRGHGFSPERRGDIDYISQLEDDLHDFISFIKKSKPNSKIVLGGHSSGGGFALR